MQLHLFLPKEQPCAQAIFFSAPKPFEINRVIDSAFLPTQFVLIVELKERYPQEVDKAVLSLLNIKN